MRYLKRGQPLYEVKLRDSSGLVGAKLTYSRGILKQVVSHGQGLARTESFYNATFKEGTVELAGPAIDVFDERGRVTARHSYGCGSFLQVVKETPDSLEFLGARAPFAYHPDDAPSAPPVPASLSQVRGMAYASAPGNWSGTWQQIQFSMREPQNFQYQWERKSSAQGIARAIADFDGDGQVDVRFEIPISCSSSQSGSGCQVAPTRKDWKGNRSDRLH